MAILHWKQGLLCDKIFFLIKSEDRKKKEIKCLCSIVFVLVLSFSCRQFTSLLDNLRTLMIAQCSGDPHTVWITFFYTLVTPCDSSRTPSVYANYSDTVVTQCADANSVLPENSLLVICCILVALISLIAL